jgi:hypothetical protein
MKKLVICRSVQRIDAHATSNTYPPQPFLYAYQTRRIYYLIIHRPLLRSSAPASKLPVANPCSFLIRRVTKTLQAAPVLGSRISFDHCSRSWAKRGWGRRCQEGIVCAISSRHLGTAPCYLSDVLIRIRDARVGGLVPLGLGIAGVLSVWFDMPNSILVDGIVVPDVMGGRKWEKVLLVLILLR